MQAVSNAYKKSIRRIGRNRGYIRVTVGLVNSKAQKNIDTSQTNLARFSRPKLKDSIVVNREYAMADQNFTKADGKRYFLPPRDNNSEIYYNGLVTEELLGVAKITFAGQTSLDIKGLTIDFSDCYPTRFRVTNGSVTNEYTNDSRYFDTTDVYENTEYLLITPLEMSGGQNRLRIYSLQCGRADVFTNTEVINYSGTEYVSAICDTLPSNDVSITVNNADLHYCPDDPNSPMAYLEMGQEVKTEFGYDPLDDGNIEWLEGKVAYLSGWEANNETATLKATDIFNNISSIYYRGNIYPDGISLYDLAEDVFDDAGISNYSIDSYLQDIIVYNPVPAVDHSSALQIIANAGRSTILEDRQGNIRIQSNIIPSATAESDDETAYSKAMNVVEDIQTISYAEASEDYTYADGEMYFLPHDDFGDTAFVSSSVANGDGEFENNPVLEIDFESTFKPFFFGISFVNNYPRQFIMRLYDNSQLVTTKYIVCNTTSFIYDEQLQAFDHMEIEFTEGAPNSRVFVSNINLGKTSDYFLKDNNELNSHPLATRQAKVKSISIGRTSYSESTEEKSLFKESFLVDPDEPLHTVYFNKAVHGLSISVETAGITASITSSSAYYATIKFSGATTPTDVEYEVSGYEYNVEEQTFTKQHNSDGEDISWNNPLISSVEHAKLLEEWLYDWYKGDVEYDIDWRGDPRVDANDMFYMDNVLGNSVPIRAYESTLEFSNSGWAGRMKARKVSTNDVANS